MNKDENFDKQFNIFKLAWPLYLEFTLRILMNNVDILMISNYSEKAISAVSIATQILSIAIVFGGVLTNGTSILISQYLGAKEDGEINIIANNSIFLNGLIGIFLGATITFFSRNIIEVFSAQKEIVMYGSIYLRIVGGFFFLELLSIVTSSILRCFGLTKQNMYIMFLVNIINVLGNFVVLNVLSDEGISGIIGISIVNNVSRFLGLILLIAILIKKTKVVLMIKAMVSIKVRNIKKIFSVGIATGISQLTYQLCQLIITYMIISFGSESLNAKIYSQNIFNFVTLIPGAISKANQIIIGYRIGGKNYKKAYESSIINSAIGASISTSLLLVLLFFADDLLSIYTYDQLTIKYGIYYMVLIFLSEPGRTFNLIIGSSLHAAGDINYSVMLNVISMFFISVLFSYILGVQLNLGLAGIGIAMFLDETLRAVLLLKRWKSKKWAKKVYV